MLNQMRSWNIAKRISKMPWYARMRRYFPGQDHRTAEEDMTLLASAETVLVDWPEGLPKPMVGIIKDYDIYPHWTKYARFCENNNFPYEIYDLRAYDWQDQARKFGIIVGFLHNEYFLLMEMRRKFFVLETYMGITCLPSFEHISLYEDKVLESYLANAYGLPFAKTHVANRLDDALAMIEHLTYPQIHKIVPSSGSVGVQMVRTKDQARKIVKQAFSPAGRSTHMLYYRQKNSVYFQDFLPNDGYDIRVMVAGNEAFGYVRKVLKGDFRASGMHSWEWGPLPDDAVRLAFRLNETVKSPMLIVDMVHGLDGKFTIIEFSPNCQIDTPEQLIVDGVAGAYSLEQDGRVTFRPRRVWMQ